MLDDGTGSPLTVRIFFDGAGNDTPQVQEQSEAWVEGLIVRATGILKSFHGKRSLNAKRLLPIENFDEYTCHFLECLHVYLSSNRQSKGGARATGGTPFQPQPGFVKKETDNYSRPSLSNARNDKGFSDLQNQVSMNLFFLLSCI